jgi:ribonuclease-3
MLFRNFPKANEGELSRRLADLVRKETCADMARKIDLGAAIRLGSSEAAPGGRSRDAILADVCESLIGAVFLDGGYSAAAALVETLWDERMRTPATAAARSEDHVAGMGAGTRAADADLSRDRRSGPHHSPEFRIAVELPKLAPAKGIGRSKRAAEQAPPRRFADAKAWRQIAAMAEQPAEATRCGFVALIGAPMPASRRC